MLLFLTSCFCHLSIIEMTLSFTFATVKLSLTLRRVHKGRTPPVLLIIIPVNQDPAWQETGGKTKLAEEAMQVLAEASSPLLSDTLRREHSDLCMRTLPAYSKNGKTRTGNVSRSPSGDLKPGSLLPPHCGLCQPAAAQGFGGIAAPFLAVSMALYGVLFFFFPPAVAERSPLTGGPGPHRVNSEFTRLAISHLPKSPRIHCRLCLLSLSF